MNVLVTGGYGFIGSFVAEKFYREGHKVFILDNLSTGNKSNVTCKHQHSLLSIENEGCEEIFRVNKFDIVVHLAAQVDVKTSLENPVWDVRSNVYGLANMLHLSKKYGVQKFIFASSAAVYGQNDQVPLRESFDCNPISPYGLNKLLGERYCQEWRDIYGLETLCLRFSNVYGPKQGTSGEGGVVSTFLHNLHHLKPLTVFGDGTQTRDFIYVEDVAEAIYRSVLSDVSGVFNLSSNEEITINEMIDILNDFIELPDVLYREPRAGDIKRSRLDNTNILMKLDWVPKYSIREGLEKTYKWYRENENQKRVETKKDTDWTIFFKKVKTYLPFIENAFLFILTILLDLTAQRAFQTIDFKILYILFIGIWLGKNQSILASGLTIILYTYDHLINGREFVSLFIDEETLLNFSIYLFLGIVSGYVVDKKKAKEQATRRELDALQEKYSFLSEIYHETRKMKEELHAQIVNSEDSIGKVYSIVKKLDSLETEKIFTEAIFVLEKTLNTSGAAIYIIGQNRQFVRLISNSKKLNQSIPKSLRIEGDSVLENVLYHHNLFINKELVADTPMIMAPIVKDGEGIALVCLYDVDFNQLTLHYKNLLQVVIDLISVSLTRAFEYVRATNNERYINGTTILEPSHFSSILTYKQKMREELGVEFTLMELPRTADYDRHIQMLEVSLRETDYIGMDEEGNTYILFSTTPESDAEKVMSRLHGKSIPVKLAKKEIIHV